MKTKIKAFLGKPYNLFLVMAMILVIASLLDRGKSFDIHIHDTFILFSSIYLDWLLAFIFFLGWALYKATNKFLLSNYLSWVHVVSTLLFLVLCQIFYYWLDKQMPPINIGDFYIHKFRAEQRRQQVVDMLLAITFIVGQLTFIVNLLGGLLKRRK